MPTLVEGERVNKAPAFHPQASSDNVSLATEGTFIPANLS